MSIGKNIKKFRKQRKLTQQELADMIKISRSYLGDIENDRKNISTKTLEELAKKLNISPSELLIGNESYSEVGHSLLEQIKNNDDTSDEIFESIEYLKKSGMLNTALIKAVYKLLSISSINYKNPTDLLNKNLDDIEKNYFEEVILYECIKISKPNSIFISNNIKKIHNLFDIDFTRYYPEKRLDVGIKMGKRNNNIKIDIFEKNLDKQLLEDVAKIFIETRNKIEALKSKYPQSESQKVAECFLQGKYVSEKLGNYEISDSASNDPCELINTLMPLIIENNPDLDFENAKILDLITNDMLINIKNDGD